MHGMSGNTQLKFGNTYLNPFEVDLLSFDVSGGGLTTSRRCRFPALIFKYISELYSCTNLQKTTEPPIAVSCC